MKRCADTGCRLRWFFLAQIVRLLDETIILPYGFGGYIVKISKHFIDKIVGPFQGHHFFKVKSIQPNFHSYIFIKFNKIYRIKFILTINPTHGVGSSAHRGVISPSRRGLTSPTLSERCAFSDSSLKGNRRDWWNETCFAIDTEVATEPNWSPHWGSQRGGAIVPRRYWSLS